MVPVILLVLFRLASAQADIIYDNSGGSGTNIYYSPLEYGDEVVLAQGMSRQMGQFLFEYYGDFVASGDEQAQLRLYRNDGPTNPLSFGSPTPGTLLFDSGPFSLEPGYQYKIFSGLNLTLPDDLTWTIQFTGLTENKGDRAGLIFRDPPAVGTSYDDVWIKTGGTWQLFHWENANPKANFAARIVSVDAGNTISIRREAKQVIIEWSGLSILQVASNARGPFTDLANIRNRYVIDPTKAIYQFWRLRD
jgi:hypothetical protein